MRKIILEIITILLLLGMLFVFTGCDNKEQEETVINNLDNNITKNQIEENLQSSKDINTLEKSNEESNNIDELKELAQKYYNNTVFEVVSMEIKKSEKDMVIFEVTCKKDGVLVDPNRTITIEKENNEWKVTNEGY